MQPPMRSKAPISRPLHLAAALALLGLSASCGGDGPAPPPPGSEASVQELTLSPVLAREVGTPRKVLELRPPADFDAEDPLAGPWKARSKKAGLQPLPGLDGARALMLLGRNEDKVLRIERELDPSTFNGVVLDLYTTGEQSVIVLGYRAGRPVVNSEGFTVRGEDGIQHIPFDLTKLHGEEAMLEALEIRFQRSTDLVGIAGVTLTSTPFSTFLPSSAAPDLISCGGPEPELRRGFGVSSEAPEETTFEVQEGGELVFSYSYPAPLRVRRARPELHVDLLRGEETVKTVTCALEVQRQVPDWHQERIELAPWAGEQLTARFRVETKRPDREVLAAVGGVRQRVRGERPPTVLLISSDTHRADHVGAASPEAPVYTPVLDSLGMRGVFFENGFTATNVTNPSHIALLTGVHPRDTRILNNHTPLVDNAVTLAERFREAGYRTFAAVSAHHLVDQESGLGQGFERMSAPRAAERPAPVTFSHVLEWLDDASGEPVFVFLHFFDVHAPYEPTGEYDRKYYGKDKDPYDPGATLQAPLKELPPFLAGLTDADFPYQQYRAEVDYLDAELDDVLNHERLRDGIIAFTSDHGESFGEHGIWWDHAGLYPTSIHVPLMVRWPGGPKSLRVDSPVRQIDVGRTLLDLSGLERSDFPGRSLTWAIETPEQSEPRFALAAHAFCASVTVGPWHLILNLRREFTWPLEQERPPHEVELYHLGRDPGCTENLVDEEFERARELRSRLIDWLDAADPVGLGRTGGVQRSSAQASLEALGYAAGGEEDAADPGQAWYLPDPENEWVQRFERGQ